MYRRQVILDQSEVTRFDEIYEKVEKLKEKFKVIEVRNAIGELAYQSTRTYVISKKDIEEFLKDIFGLESEVKVEDPKAEELTEEAKSM